MCFNVIINILAILRWFFFVFFAQNFFEYPVVKICDFSV